MLYHNPQRIDLELYKRTRTHTRGREGCTRMHTAHPEIHYLTSTRNTAMQWSFGDQREPVHLYCAQNCTRPGLPKGEPFVFCWSNFMCIRRASSVCDWGLLLCGVNSGPLLTTKYLTLASDFNRTPNAQRERRHLLRHKAHVQIRTTPFSLKNRVRVYEHMSWA